MRPATVAMAGGPVPAIGLPSGQALVGLDVAPGTYRVVPLDNDSSVLITAIDPRGLFLEQEVGTVSQIIEVPPEALFLNWIGTLERVN